MDAQGAAVLIGAFVVAGNFAMSVVTFVQGQRRSAKLDTIHNLVNGQSELLEAAAMARGKLEGVQQERDHPMEPRR